MIKEQLPSVPYMTDLDKYVYVCRSSVSVLLYHTVCSREDQFKKISVSRSQKREKHHFTRTYTHRYIFAVTTMLFAQAFMHLLPKKYGIYVDLMCFQILVGFFVIQHTWALWVLYVLFFKARSARERERERESRLKLRSILLPFTSFFFFLHHPSSYNLKTHTLTHNRYSGNELRNHLRKVHSDVGLNNAIQKRRRLSSIFKKSI